MSCDDDEYEAFGYLVGSRRKRVHVTLMRWQYRSLWSLWRNRHNFVWVPPDWPEVVTVVEADAKRKLRGA